jgi:microcin C transport system substrate-binding protein
VKTNFKARISNLNLRLTKIRLVLISFFAIFFLYDTGTTGAVTSPATAAKAPAGKTSAASRRSDEMRIRIPAEPTSLNPIDGANWAAGDVHNHIFESLLIQDPDTLAWRPRLAEKWERSADEREYTFTLRADAKWSDGTPLTADDVKFTFDAIFDDRFAAAQVRPYYEGIERVEVLGPQTVKFVTRVPYFGNFISCAQMNIVPRHVYGNPADSEHLQLTAVGSGPYAFDLWQSGRMIRLKKNLNWWGWAANAPEAFGRPNFISLYFVTDNNVAIEMMRKGELDYSPLTSDEFARLENEESRGFIVERVQNQVPKNVRSLAFNLTKPLFQDRVVRKAISRLVDREMIVERFFHGFMMPASGPWYSQSVYADPSRNPDAYDPAGALSMLREAGWEDSNKDFILDRRSQSKVENLHFTVMTASPDDIRFLSVLKQDARQVGVDIDLKLVSEVVFNEAMRTGRFDAAIVSRGAAWVEFDPKVSWNSKSLPINGYNFGRYNDPASDALIERAVIEPSFEKRIPIMRELYNRIVDEAPEVFLFNERDTFYAVGERVERDKPTYNYDVGTVYWRLKGWNKMMQAQSHP